MDKFISDIADVDNLCKTISVELDLPEGYYKMKLGDSDLDDQGSYLFQLKKKTFARSPAQTKYTKLHILENTLSYSDFPMGLIHKKLQNDTVITLGFECLQKNLYWLFYRLMYEAAESSGSNFFGCCSRYVECSAGYGCVQPIKELRYDCIYRKNLHKGLNFYGQDKKFSQS